MSKCNREKTSSPRQKRSGRSAGKRPGVIDRLTDGESAALLRILLSKHASLRVEAERLAIQIVGASSPAEIANSVFDAVTSIDIDALNDRAGATHWDYVEPTDAAWQLLEEAVEDFVSDMKRRMNVGLEDEAITICRGVIAGLFRAEECGKGDVLDWAPDFPKEEADHVVAELLRANRGGGRNALRSRVAAILAEEAPAWTNMLKRVVRQTVRTKM
jgi:hypothetical protein